MCMSANTPNPNQAKLLFDHCSCVCIYYGVPFNKLSVPPPTILAHGRCSRNPVFLSPNGSGQQHSRHSNAKGTSFFLEHLNYFY